MQTEYLKEFLVLANQLNFRKAAEKLHLSHPALSKHIAALETELGFQLFDRSGSTKLTVQGECFLVYAQRILNIIDEGVEKCLTCTSERVPANFLWSDDESVRLGRMLPLVKTPLTLVEPKSSESALQALQSGRADVVMVYCVDSIPGLADRVQELGFVSRPIGKERLSLLMSRSNPLASKGALRRSDLRDAEIYLGYGDLFENQALATSAILGEDLHLKFVYDPVLIRANFTISLYEPGQGIIAAYWKLIHDACESRPDFVAFDDVDGEPLAVDEYLAYRAKDPNPNVLSFVEEICTMAEEEQAQPSSSTVSNCTSRQSATMA